MMLGFLSGMMQMNDLGYKWDQMRKDRGSAESTGKTKCTNCGVCCWQRPCTFTKKEFVAVAKHLKLTQKKAFSTYFAVDEIKSECTLIAIRHGQDDIAGKYVPCDRTFDDKAPCIFRDEDAKECKIHSVKPIQGSGNKCWEEGTGLSIAVWRETALNELGWDGIKDDDDY